MVSTQNLFFGSLIVKARPGFLRKAASADPTAKTLFAMAGIAMANHLGAAAVVARGQLASFFWHILSLP